MVIIDPVERQLEPRLEALPAINVQHLAKDVASAVAAQKQDCVSNVVAIGDASAGFNGKRANAPGDFGHNPDLWHSIPPAQPPRAIAIAIHAS